MILKNEVKVVIHSSYKLLYVISFVQEWLFGVSLTNY